MHRLSAFLGVLCTGFGFVGFQLTTYASIIDNPGFDRLVRETAANTVPKRSHIGAAALLPDGTQPVDPYPDHTVFANQAAAITWAQGQAAQLAKSIGANTFNVIDPATDSRYGVLQSYLHDTWTAYQELFAPAVGNLPEPQVIIVQTEVVNALVMPDLATGKIGHAVWVFTALIDAASGVANRDIYTGLFGHELAHTVFRHLLPKYQAFYSRYYQPSAEPEAQFGYQSTNDTNLASEVSQWEADADLAGYADWAELEDFPAMGGALYDFPLAIKDYTDSSPACQTAMTALQSLRASPPYGLSVVYQVLEPNTNLADVESSTQALIEQMSACSTQPSLEASHPTMESYGVQPAAPGSLFEGAIQAYDGATDSTSSLLAATGLIRADMLALDSQIQFATLRWFSYEEHADSVSALINYQMSLDKTSSGPLALNVAFGALATATGADPTELATCRADVAAGKAQSIGLPEDPHHDICYRLSNVTQLSGTIQGNSAEFANFAADFLARSTPPGGF